MSDDQNDKSGSWFGNPLPVIMVVLLAAGIVANNISLESARPTDSERVQFAPASEQDVEARLWQDPFAAIEKHKKSPDQAIAPTGNIFKEFSWPYFLKPPPKPHTPDVLRNRIEQLKSDITVLAVSVFGTSYAEDAETRRRTRFAVISALGFNDFHPVDAGAIGYFHIEMSQHKIRKPTYDDDVPYEWFEKEDQSHSVLVLWLKDEKLTTKPLATLRNLYDELKPKDELRDLFNKLRPPQRPYGLNIKLIGPAGSKVLTDLVAELQSKPLPNVSPIEVYSPSATVSNCNLLHPWDKQPVWDCVKGPRNLPTNENFPIVRTTGTDDLLAAALLWELWQRGINREQGDKSQCADGLVLIGERDTRYGRTLLQYLTDGFSDRCGSKKQVRKFSYLRGLDGVLADADKPGNTTPTKDDTGKSKDLLAQLKDAPKEHAEGRNQFDYLRRLADEIDRLDGDKTFAKYGVKAIGLVGSDLYDKLLILQALRDRFKTKIFFTTDLDARYLHADQKEWTRNLVVASNFGFSLNSQLQPSTLPFRDSYQTARYLATLMALEKQDSPGYWPDKMKQWLGPQIFEIGRTEAVHLASPSVKRLTCWVQSKYSEDSHEYSTCLTKNGEPENNGNVSTAAKELCAIDWRMCNNIEPIRPPYLSLLDHPFDPPLYLMGLFGFLLFALANHRVNQTLCAAFSASSDERKKTWARIGLVIALVFVVSAFLWWVHDGMEDSLEKDIGEPFVWLEGISAWPNLTIRFVGLLTVLGLWCLFGVKMRDQKNRITKEFEIPRPEAWACNRSWQSAVWTGPYLDLASTNKKENGVAALWHNYLRATSVREMWLWIGASIVFTIVLLLAIASRWDIPSFPHRGMLVLTLHYSLFVLHSIVFWLIIFWVGYETRACVQFINTLSNVHNKWPRPLLLRKASETRISPAHLDDYLDLQLIVQTTQRIQWLIYLPFISIFVLVLARSNFFSAMDLPLPFILIVSLALTYLLYSARLLRKRAEKMHATVLTKYENLQAKPWLPTYTAQIDRLISRIRTTNTGVFAPFAQQPALQALLLPFGGYGGVQIIEYLVKFFGAP